MNYFLGYIFLDIDLYEDMCIFVCIGSVFIWEWIGRYFGRGGRINEWVREDRMKERETRVGKG